MPSEVVLLIKGYWIGGVWLCKVCNSWPSVASGISILTNLLIATDRFLGLYSPLLRNTYADNRFHIFGFLIVVTVPSLIAGHLYRTKVCDSKNRSGIPRFVTSYLYQQETPVGNTNETEITSYCILGFGPQHSVVVPTYLILFYILPSAAYSIMSFGLNYLIRKTKRYEMLELFIRLYSQTKELILANQAIPNWSNTDGQVLSRRCSIWLFRRCNIPRIVVSVQHDEHGGTHDQ